MPLKLKEPKPKTIVIGLKNYTDAEIKQRMAQLTELGYDVAWKVPPPGAEHNGVLQASLHERTKRKAFYHGRRSAVLGMPCDSKARSGSMWDEYYLKGFRGDACPHSPVRVLPTCPYC